VVDQDKGRVIVARGTFFPANTQSDNMVHNNPIASHNVRVSIDDVGPEYQLTPLPVSCDELETVGSAAGSFVQWPKDLVTLGHVYFLTFEVLKFFSHIFAIYHVAN
jgi:hypothetical protein